MRPRAIATPGHTPEHLSWLVSDRDRPVSLFSGGVLLVNAVARTDVIIAGQTEPVARTPWRSLHRRIFFASRKTSPSTPPMALGALLRRKQMGHDSGTP